MTQFFSIFFFHFIIFIKAQQDSVQSPNHFSFNGYLRTGIGGASNSGSMVEFVTPSNLHKFRMGNEANHYSELQFQYKYQELNTKESYEVKYMMSKFIPYGENFDSNFVTSQLYTSINNVFKNTKIWIGKRYYDRMNIEMLDYFWINSGQNSEVGFGIENIKLSKTNINVALFKFQYDKASQVTQKSNSYTADIRFKDYNVNDNLKLNIVNQLSYKTSNDVDNTPTAFGFGIGGWIDYKKQYITYTSSLIYHKGPQIVANGYTGKSPEEFSNYIRNYDLTKAYDLTFTNNFLYDDKLKYALQMSLVYSNKSYGIGNVREDNIVIDNKKMINWLSFGFRYLYYLHKHFNLAFEAGNDYIKDSKKDIEGSLQKITFSPQISWNYGYYTRPVIRFFITYATWSDSFKGATGVNEYNSYFKNKTHGLTYGAQLEVSW